MRQANERLRQLQARLPLPSIGTSPNFKRRSQLLNKKLGGDKPPLSPSLSLRLVQGGSDQERALSAPMSTSGERKADAQDDSGNACGVLNISTRSLDSPKHATDDQQPSCTAPRISALKFTGTDGQDLSSSIADAAHNPSFRLQRLVLRRESSFGSLSSNAATMRLPRPKFSVPDSADAADTSLHSLKGTSSITRSTPSAGQSPVGRTFSGADAVGPRSWESRAPPPACTVTVARVAAPRPVPTRSLPVLTEALRRPASADANLGVTRMTASANARKNAICLHARVSSPGLAPGASRVVGALSITNFVGHRGGRASPSTLPKAPSPSVEYGTRPMPRSASAGAAPRALGTLPPTAPPRSVPRPLASREVRLLAPSEHTRSMSGPLRTSTGLTGRGSTQNGPPGRVPVVGDWSRTKTGPQILNSGLRQHSSSSSRVPPRSDTSASRMSLPATMDLSVDMDSPSGLHKISGPMNSTNKTIKQQVHSAVDRPVSTSGSLSQRSEPSIKPSISDFRSVPSRSDTKPVVKITSSATQQSSTALLSGRLNINNALNPAPRPSARRRASRPYHTQAQSTPSTASATPLSPVTRQDGQGLRVTRRLCARVMSTTSRPEVELKGASPKVSVRIPDVDAFDIAEIKACLFGHTPLTGPPRPHTAALRHWLAMLPGLSGLFCAKGSSVFVNLDVRPQVFAMRRSKDAAHLSRETIDAFLRSGPVPQPVLALQGSFCGIHNERVPSAARPSWQKPEAIEDIFLIPGGPSEGEKMRMPPPGAQPRRESLRRALNRLARFGTPTRVPSPMHPLLSGSKMDGYLATLEAQTFNHHGRPRNDAGGPGHGTYGHRALVRMMKSVCRATCRNATKLVLGPWRLLVRLLLRQ